MDHCSTGESGGREEEGTKLLRRPRARFSAHSLSVEELSHFTRVYVTVGRELSLATGEAQKPCKPHLKYSDTTGPLAASRKELRWSQSEVKPVILSARRKDSPL